VKALGRIAMALVLVAVGLGVPCVYLWVSGAAAAEAERAAILAAPEHEARAAAARIATRITRELNELAAREGARPYYDWQSVIVDPRGLYEGEAVVPSPLAAGPTEPLVSSHFQIDEAGTVTSPEVNEAKGAPEPSPVASARLGQLRSALEGRRAEGLTPVVSNTVDAGLGNGPGRGNEPNVGELIQVANAEERVQEQRIDNVFYQQNARAPETFEQLQKKAPQKRQADAGGEVTVRVGDFVWEQMQLAGKVVLAATRAVETPDAARRQGFVVEPSRLEALLSDGAMSGTLSKASAERDGVQAPLGLPGLSLAVTVPTPDARALADEAERPLHEFRVRVGALTGFAVLTALAIMALVVHAERLSERRQRFAAAAAHELRTPLAGLRMYAEMLAHGLGKPDKQKAYAERLASEAARLGRVVSNVLDFTRLERKSLAVRATPQDVAAAVEDFVRDHEPSIAAAGARLVLVRPDGPVMAMFDSDALAQILGNLVDNAEKYSRDAADRTITVSVVVGARDRVEVRVADRGPGLPKKSLFKPFERGAPKDGPAGLGLGLALARALARAQGGELDAAPVAVGAELVIALVAPASQ
jgi:signal transduction histidine kinase